MEMGEEKRIDSHRMAWRLSGLITRGCLQCRQFQCRQYQNNMTTAKIKFSSDGCFHVKCSILDAEASYCRHLSLHCCVLFTLFCLSLEASTFVCLFLLHLSDSTEAIEVMTWVLHLGNHFHIPQKRAVMIAFDNRQSKLHHPPRVLLYAILWRKRKRKRKRGGRVLRRRNGGSQCVGGLERESSDRGRGGQSQPGLGVDTCTHVIIDSTLKSTVHGPLVL